MSARAALTAVRSAEADFATTPGSGAAALAGDDEAAVAAGFTGELHAASDAPRTHQARMRALDSETCARLLGAENTKAADPMWNHGFVVLRGEGRRTRTLSGRSRMTKSRVALQSFR